MTVTSFNHPAPRFGMWPFREKVVVQDEAVVNALMQKVDEVIASDKFEVTVSRQQTDSDNVKKIDLTAKLTPKKGSTSNVSEIEYAFHGYRSKDNYYYSYSNKFYGSDQEALTLKTKKQKLVYSNTASHDNAKFRPAFQSMYDFLNKQAKANEDEAERKRQEAIKQAEQIKELKSKKLKDNVTSIKV